MKKSFWIVPALVLSLGGGLQAADQCRATQTAVIDAETQCVPAGINIGYFGDTGAKVACLESKEVQRVCGSDGRVTRLHAYTLWYNKLQQFQATCASQGGVFNYQDPLFIEPTNESYCLAAQPEVSSNMFEEPLCNFRSMCPAVTVVCDFPCKGRTAEVPPDAQTVSLSPFLPATSH